MQKMINQHYGSDATNDTANINLCVTCCHRVSCKWSTIFCKNKIVTRCSEFAEKSTKFIVFDYYEHE